MDKRYSIGEVAEITGVSRRTIRFYVQQGLLEPPHGAGRGYYYTDGHIERLGKIQKLQEAGLALREIPARLADRKSGAEQPDIAVPLSVAEPWLRYLVATGCEIHLQAGVCRMTQSRFERLQQAVRSIFPELDTYPSKEKSP